MDHHLAWNGAFAVIAQIDGSKIRLVQQTGSIRGIAAARNPALNELQGSAGFKGQWAVVLRAVARHGSHRVRRPGSRCV